jgi:hypothetical protein
MVRRVREDRRQVVRRYGKEGEPGLLDRSSAPGRVHNATPLERVEAPLCAGCA